VEAISTPATAVPAPTPAAAAGPSTPSATPSAIVSWNEANERTLLRILKEAGDAGQRGQNGFKEVVFNQVVAQIFAERGVRFTTKQVRNKVDYLKRRWRSWKMVIKNSGFRYNNDHHLPTAPNNMWVAFIQVSLTTI
jgi:hypothetical protein